VLGADPAVHEGWSGPYDVQTTFHEPLVLFGYVLVAFLAWSRVALEDHTVAQVVAGAVLGAGAAALAYAALVSGRA